MKIKLFVSCPKGVENLLQEELQHFGGSEFRQTVGGIYCESEFDSIYRICLWSRLANRVVWLLEQVNINSKDDIYRTVKRIMWPAVFSLQKSFAVDFRGTNKFITHSNYGALLVKDAVADHFTEELGRRPNVDVQNPDVQLYARLRKNQFVIGIEMSGGSLHRRGYRLDGARAPLKENLAAALMLRTGLKTGDTRILLDPLCGSGTLLIEGVMIRLGLAPGLQREKFGFESLVRHKPDVWKQMVDEARQQRDHALMTAEEAGQILAYGYDQDVKVIATAKQNAQRAGLAGLIEFKHQALLDFASTIPGEHALLVTNPPYGERLSERNTLFPIYQMLGEKIRQYCQGGMAAVLSSDDYLLKALSLQKSKAYHFYNGELKIDWLLFQIYKKAVNQQEDAREGGLEIKEDSQFEKGVEMVANRLRKNGKRLQNWLKQQEIHCYRVYDADMPEYAFALDCYGDHYQLTEYAPPKLVDQYAAFQRRQQFIKAVKTVFALRDHQLVLKERRQQKGKAQYEKLDESKHYFLVKEGEARLWVNLHDYLDTGLFLDHRPVRKMIGEIAEGKRFLNLFSYTSAATVHAALGGAKSSTSVDMSNTYIEWSQRNFRSNRLDMKRHVLVRANCLEWLARCRDQYDLVFLDPPSFSNSKKMETTFDVQRDQRTLIEDAMRVLAPEGTLVFSNNRRDFKLDPFIEEKFLVENITPKTIDKDFERNPKIHGCWLISKR